MIGFTGTRYGMSTAQHAAVYRLLENVYPRTVAYHGGCAGADIEFGEIASIKKMVITILPGHSASECPPSQDVLRARYANIPHHILETSRPFMKRNRLIVQRANHVIATPFEMDEQETGGTWATIRMARRDPLRKLTIILRDGRIVA